MMVVKPIRVTLENLPADFYLPIEKALHPKNPALGTNTVPFTSTVFIDADDFRPVADPNFFRLCPGATIGLLNVPKPVTYVSHETDVQGNVTSIVCHYEDGPGPAPKPKAWIQWVAEHRESRSPVPVTETRLFSRLFKSDDPAALGDDYIKDIDPDSKRVVTGALLETGIWTVIDESLARVRAVVEERLAEAKKNGTEAPPMVEGVEAIRFQGLRVAYFALDLDSKLIEDGQGDKRDGELVLNLIAPLKQDSGAGKKV
jgi:glutaminyl-tRNA synthetase